VEVESKDFWESGGGKLRLLGEWRGRVRIVGRFEGESKECR